MNLYDYLFTVRKLNRGKAAKAAAEAYNRFIENGKTLVPRRETDPFTFVMSDHGYQAFLFRPDQVVETDVGLGIVTGWGETMSGWHVRGRVAKGDFYWRAEDLKQAAYPEGLVEILRGKVHTKVDEAFES